MSRFTLKLLRSFLLVSCLFFIFACSKDEASISVDKSQVEVTVQGATFMVSSNVDWTISQSGNYVFGFSPKNGVPGETQVNVSYTPNDSDQPRNSTLTITGGGASAQVQLVQDPLEFKVSVDTLRFGAKVETRQLAITSNTEWNVKGITVPEWISSISPEGGSGNGELSITVKENTSRLSENSFLLRITYGGSLQKKIEVKQDAAYNNPPTKPELIYPGNNEVNVSTLPLFSWKESEDAEGDEIVYYVHISEDGNSWTKFSAGSMTSSSLSSRIGVLKPNTKYYYKVVANDNHSKGITESDVFTFTTTSKDAYADGDYAVYMQSAKSSPVVLFFTGDGYLQEHFKYGGQFDRDIDEAIEALFSIEPYKSYKEYFTVYKIAAYSNQTGITNLAENDHRDTRFRLQWEGGNSTGISIPDSGKSIFELCKTIDGITDSHLKNGAIGVISNADVYAGTCLSYIDGRSIASIPYLRNAKNSQTTFANVVCHEMGGHGFGRLADEYTNNSGTVPDEDKESLLYWQSRGYSRNVSAYPQQSASPWANFIGLKDYTHVSMFEGGYYYKQGIWRPEKISCMQDNRLYYNSPSRYYIVERIMQIAGEELTLEKFIAKDVQKTDNTSQTKSSGEKFVPLAPPVLIID